MSRLRFTKSATPSTPASNKSEIHVDTVTRRLMQLDDNGVHSVLNNIGMQQLNLLGNGGFAVQQRVATAVTAVPGASLTTRAGQVADRWAVTTGHATTVLWTQINAGTTTETGLNSKFYGRITQNTNAAKFILSQVLTNEETSALRGKKVRLSCKIKQQAGANAVYRLGIVCLGSGGTADSWPAITSALNGASSDPTLGTNLTYMVPDASPTGENGTISGNALSITSTANWVRSSVVFTISTSSLNCAVVLYRDTIGAASDALSVAEFQLTEGPDIIDWVTLPLTAELLRCQRYFCKSFPQTVVPAASVSVATGGHGASWILGKTGSGTVLGSQISIVFPVVMWKTPTITYFTPITTGAVIYRHSGTTPAVQGTTATVTSSLTDRGAIVSATNEATTNGAIGDLISIHYIAEAEFIT